MKIVVCVKQVPDTAAKVIVDENGQATWGDAPLVLNPWDEYAVEAALQLNETHGGEVIAVSMGDENALEALKHSLAMGANEAIRVYNTGLEKIDTLGTSKILAAAIQKIGDVDVVLFGKQAIDGDGGVTASQTGRALGWPVLSLAANVPNVEPDTSTISTERATEEGRQYVESKLPAVVSVIKDIGEPRYPSFMGIRKASRAQIPLWSLDDLGIEPPKVSVEWPELMNPPSREVNCEFIEGETPEEKAEKLVERILEEKVI